MQITEKLREEILLSLPKLSIKAADKIAKDCGVHRDTIYRQYRKLKSDKPVFENAVMLKLAELAASNKKEVIGNHKRLAVLEKQLAAIK